LPVVLNKLTKEAPNREPSADGLAFSL